MSTSESLTEFKDALSQLNVNDKRTIQKITTLAAKNCTAAKTVVKVFDSVAVIGLLKLYVIDSIAKTVGGPYKDIFAHTLPERFRNTFVVSCYDTKKKLFTLRTTWNGIFSNSTLYKLDCEVNEVDGNWPILAKRLDEHAADDGAKSRILVPKAKCHRIERTDGRATANAALVIKSKLSAKPIDSPIEQAIDVDTKSQVKKFVHKDQAKLYGIERMDGRATANAALVIKSKLSAKPIDSPIEQAIDVDTKSQIHKIVPKAKCHEIERAAVEMPTPETDEERNARFAKMLDQIFEHSGDDFSFDLGIDKSRKIYRTHAIANETARDQQLGETESGLTSDNTVSSNVSGDDSEVDDFENDERNGSDIDYEDFGEENMQWIRKKNRIKSQPKSPAQVSPNKKKPRIKWLATKEVYKMSDELFRETFASGGRVLKKSAFLYRKDSIAIEINKLYPGCVIYIDKPNVAKKYLVLRARCSHIKCRKYYLRSYYNDPQTFKIKVSSAHVTHLRPLSRQVRRYERDRKKEALLKEFPSSLRESDQRKADKAITKAGNYQVPSAAVYNVIRKEALSEQDKCSDDLDDVIKLQADPKTNFISQVLPRSSPGVYIHSKSQHEILHKLHVKREVDGTPIVLRLDASGDIARDIDGYKLLYHALSANIAIEADKTSTSLPLTEQYNSRNTSKDISKWLFDFALAHNEYYENHPVLADYVVSDFSYANFHSVLKVFNGKTLAHYLNLIHTWVNKGDEFPYEFYLLVKIKMCYTHLMKTFAEMCRRLFGKPAKLKQHKHCRVIMEILAAMIKATDYKLVVQLYKQLVVLLTNEFSNDDVDIAIVTVHKLLTPIDWNQDEYEEDLSIVDIDDLPESDPTLYKNNLFYIELEQYTHRNTFHNNNNNNGKTLYFNPSFLKKFLKRFVPIIPLWTNILWKSSMRPYSSSKAIQANLSTETTLSQQVSNGSNEIELWNQLAHRSSTELGQQYASENLQSLHILTVLHNQPLETHFGNFKRRLMQKAVELGYPPIKLGRAIVESRKMIDATIASIDTMTPKCGLNTQKSRKPYVRTKPLPPKQRPSRQTTKVTEEKENDFSPFNESKENYNKKRPLRQFNYMQPHTITTIATTKGNSSKNRFYKNGLLKCIDLYRNVEMQFVVAKNSDKDYLFNYDLDLLHQPKEMSRSLMTYTTSQLPKSGLQVEMIDPDKRVKIKLVRNTVFVLAFVDYWALLVIDRGNKTYNFINPKGDREMFQNLFLNHVTLPKTFKEKIFKTHTNIDDYHSGILCYHYMQMYINTGTLSNKKISPDYERRELQQNLVKHSADMTESCLICGSDSNDVDPDWGQCTCCDRWIHCVCGQMTVEEVEADENFQCALCSAGGE